MSNLFNKDRIHRLEFTQSKRLKEKLEYPIKKYCNNEKKKL